jgi:6-phosphogluconate dehydrogenase (decarboxylating)
MSIRMAVVGAGRMGSVVVQRLPESTRKIIIDSDTDKARRLSQEVQGTFAQALDGACDADLVAVVLPAAVVNDTVAKLVGIVKKGAVILNMATTAHIDPAIKEKNPDIAVIDAKIIGHAMSISRGEPGIIVVDCDDGEIFDRIHAQLQGFHAVVRGAASVVEKINRVASSEGIRAAVIARKKLSQLDIPDEWINVAIGTVCAGTLKSFAENDLGHFALELVQQVERELADASAR